MNDGNVQSTDAHAMPTEKFFRLQTTIGLLMEIQEREIIEKLQHPGRVSDDLLKHVTHLAQLTATMRDILRTHFSSLGNETINELEKNADLIANDHYLDWASREGIITTALPPPPEPMNDEATSNTDSMNAGELQSSKKNRRPSGTLLETPQMSKAAPGSNMRRESTETGGLENGNSDNDTDEQSSSESTSSPSTASEYLVEEEEVEHRKKEGEAHCVEAERIAAITDTQLVDGQRTRDEAARIAAEEQRAIATISEQQEVEERRLALEQKTEADRMAADDSETNSTEKDLNYSEEGEEDESAADVMETSKNERDSNNGEEDEEDEPDGSTVTPANTNGEYSEIFQRWQGSLLVAETKLLTNVQDTINAIFDTQQQGNLDRIPSLTTALICLFSSLTKANKLLAERQHNKAGKRATVVNFDVTRSHAALLLDCDTENDATETNKERPEVTNMILRVKAAIYRHDKSDDIAQADFESMITDDKLGAFIRLGHPTKKLATHVLHLGIMYTILSALTVFTLHADLSKGKYSEYTEHARELAGRVNSGATLDKDTTMLNYLKIFAFPGLENDATWELAATVVCEMFASLTQLNGERRPRLLECYKTAETKTLAGGTDVHSIYCSGDVGDCYKRRRQRVFKTCLVMILKKPIQKRLPDGFFSGRGFTRTLLRLSPSDILAGFTDIKVSFFGAVYDEDIRISKHIKNKVVEKKLKSTDDDTGERTIIIESQEQIESLKILLGCF